MNDYLNKHKLPKSKYALIVVSGSDYNRGDEALLWRNQQLVRDVFNIDDVYVINDNDQEFFQSTNKGLISVSPILEHPSKYNSKNLDNRNYSSAILVNWGFRALKDWVKTKLLLNKHTHFIGKKLLNKEKLHTLNLIKNASHVFVKGGGFLHTYGKITDSYYIYYITFHIMLALYFDKQIFVLPNSFGPFIGFRISKRISKLLNKCSIVSTRESLSREQLELINISSVEHYDMAFLLRANKTKEAVKALNLVLNKNKSNIAVTVRPYRFPETSNPVETYQNYVKTIALFCDWLIERGHNPVLVEHTYSTQNNENDKLCIDDVSRIAKYKIPILSNKKLDCEEIKYIYSNFDYLIGTRFHSVIFALSESVPSIALSYSGNKSIGIMNDIGLGDYVTEAKDISFKKLKNMFNTLINDDDYLNKVDVFLRKARKDYEAIKNEIIKFSGE